ncbi:MAG: hypothetical protein SGPRY_014442 [Prymnesium sp.]
MLEPSVVPSRSPPLAPHELLSCISLELADKPSLLTLETDLLECILVLLDGRSLCCLLATCVHLRHALQLPQWYRMLATLGITQAGMVRLSASLSIAVGTEDLTIDDCWVLDSSDDDGDDREHNTSPIHTLTLRPCTQADAARRLYIYLSTHQSCEIELLRRSLARAIVAIELSSCWSMPLWVLFAPVLSGKSWMNSHKANPTEFARRLPKGDQNMPSILSLACGGLQFTGYKSAKGELILGHLAVHVDDDIAAGDTPTQDTIRVHAVLLPPQVCEDEVESRVLLNNFEDDFCGKSCHVEFEVAIASSVVLESDDLTMNLNHGIVNLQVASLAVP